MSKYKFIIMQFDKNDEVTLEATFKTKDITPERAGAVLREELVRTKKPYCYKVYRNNFLIASKEILK